MRVGACLALFVAILATSVLAADDKPFDFKTLKARAAKSKFDLKRNLAVKEHDQAVKRLALKRDKALVEARNALLLNLRDAREAAFKAQNTQEIVRIEKAMEFVKKSNEVIASPPKQGTPPKKTVKIPRDAVKWKGHYYKVFDEPNPFAIADQRCKQMGGYVARIETAQEHQFVQALLSQRQNRLVEYWIDGNDLAVEGTWRFSDGDPITFQPWAGQEPTNAGEDEHNVAVYKGSRWGWVDLAGGHRGPGFICEWDPANPSTTTQRPALSPADRLRQDLIGTQWTWERHTFSFRGDGGITDNRNAETTARWFPLDDRHLILKQRNGFYDLLVFDAQLASYQGYSVGQPRPLPWGGKGKRVR